MNKQLIILVCVFFMFGFVSAENTSIMYGENSSGSLVPLKINDLGQLKTNLDLLNITAGDLTVIENISLGKKITFALGEMIDNIQDGWVRVVGNLNVSTGNLSLGGSLLSNDGGVLKWGGTEINTNVSIMYAQNSSGSAKPVEISDAGGLKLSIKGVRSGIWEVVGGVIQMVNEYNLNVSGNMNVTGNGYFGGNLQVIGNISGGSPVKIVGGLDVKNSSGTLALYVNDSTGNVGIGTASPAAKLQINAPDDSVSSALAIRQDNSPTNGWDFKVDTLVDGKLFLNKVVSGVNTTVMTFDPPTGNVGIGTSSPTTKLHVKDNVTVTAMFEQNASHSYTAGAFNTYFPLQIKFPNGDGEHGLIRFSSAGQMEHAFGIVQDGAGAQGDWVFQGYGGAGPGYIEQMRITQEGDVCGADADLSNCASDVRLKENVINYSIGLKEILELRPVTFDWNNKGIGLGMNNNVRNIGFIAQEVEKIVPEWVINRSDGYEKVEGEGELKFALVKAIQELSAENNELKEIICRRLGEGCL